MNKYTILLLFTTIFCACSDNIDDNNVGVCNDGAIHFAPSSSPIISPSRTSSSMPNSYGNDVFSVEINDINQETITRGTTINTIDELDEFGVYAFESSAAFNYTSSATTLMDNYQVTVDHDDSNKCYYTPIKFWPDNTDYFTFLAYAPYLTQDTRSDNGLLLQKVSGQNNITIDYEIPDDVSKQPDLMVAPIQKDKTTAADSKNYVQEDFKHTLAAIGFKIRGNDVQIKRMWISNLENKGTLKCYDTSVGENFTWTLGGTKSSFNTGIAFETGKDYVTVGGKYIDVTRDNGYMMMLPQTLGDDVELTIDCHLKNGEDTQLKLQMNKTSIKKWEAGKLYMYNLTITPFFDIDVTPVYFDPTGTTRTYTVTSIYIPSSTDPVSYFVKWKLDPSTPKPDWITTMTTSDDHDPNGATSTTFNTMATNQSTNPAITSRNNRIQKAPPVENYNLAADGETANCYIINAAGTYYFPANVMGVGDSGVDPVYSRNYLGHKIDNAHIDTDNAYAKLLWQTEKGMITEVKLDGKNIKFKTADSDIISQGSALIAIVNKGDDHAEGGTDDKIMWSWHIWSTDINPDEDSRKVDFNDNIRTFLPYQLGYENFGDYAPPRKVTLKFVQDETGGASCEVEFIQEALDTYVGYHCNYYRWGKATPFVAAKPVGKANNTFYDINNNELTYTVPASSTYDPNNNFGITTPMTMEWNNDVSGLYKIYPDLWGNSATMEKTIYDPCPKNYRVPRRGAFDGVTGVFSSQHSNLTINTAGDVVQIAHCGGIYGRETVTGTGGNRGLFGFGANADGNYTWFADNRNSSSAYYNRWSYKFGHNSSGYSENAGQAAAHYYWVIPFKYK